MGRDINDFVLDSKGHCFFCLNQIPVVKHEPESEPRHFPKYSLHYLSRYLKMDMGKVFHNLDQIPSDLLARIENSRLKVELCEECVRLTDQFSGICRKLEKVELELGSCLKLINAKFLNIGKNDPDKTNKFKKLTDMGPQQKLSSGGELEILEVLREEAFQKSNHKLRSAVPRVKFRNLTITEIRAEQLKFQPNINIANKQQETHFSASNMEDTSITELRTSASQIKLETQDILYGHDNGPSNDFNSDNEAMCEDIEDTKLTTEGKDDINYIGAGSSAVANVATKTYRISKTNYETDKLVWNINPETGKFKCVTCSLEFANKRIVRTHYESVHLKVRFQCVTCGKEFSQRGPCGRHQKTVHEGVRYACQVCNESFKHTFLVRQHQQKTECGKKLGLNLKSNPRRT